MSVWYVTISGRIVSEHVTRKEALAAKAAILARGTARHTVKIERD